MEQLSKKIASNISLSLGKTEEEQEIIAYGLLGILQLISNISLTLFFGWLFGVPFQALFLSFTVSLLRRFSGGAHAETLSFCTLIGLVYSILFAKVSVYLTLNTFRTLIWFGLSGLILILAWIIVAVYAPVDSPKKPIRSLNKRQRMRKGSFQTLTLLTLGAVTLFIIGCNHKTFLSYGFSLVFGLLWQTFSLTPVGTKLLNNLDKRFIQRR